MTRIKKTVRTAAHKFLRELCPTLNIEMCSWTGPERDIIDLVESAFALYDAAWNDRLIAQWQYPATELRESGRFDGNQPWTVLLKRAVSLARARTISAVA